MELIYLGAPCLKAAGGTPVISSRTVAEEAESILLSDGVHCLHRRTLQLTLQPLQDALEWDGGLFPDFYLLVGLGQP